MVYDINLIEHDLADVLNLERPTFIVIDEFQEFCDLPINSSGSDAEFIALSRQAKCCNILSIQSIASLSAKAMNQDSLLSLLNNCQNIISFKSQDLITKKILKNNGLSQELYVIPDLQPFQAIIINPKYSRGHIFYVPRSFQPRNMSWFDYIKNMATQKVDLNELWLEHMLQIKGKIKKFKKQKYFKQKEKDKGDIIRFDI